MVLEPGPAGVAGAPGAEPTTKTRLQKRSARCKNPMGFRERALLLYFEREREGERRVMLW